MIRWAGRLTALSGAFLLVSCGGSSDPSPKPGDGPGVSATATRTTPAASTKEAVAKPRVPKDPRRAEALRLATVEKIRRTDPTYAQREAQGAQALALFSSYPSVAAQNALKCEEAKHAAAGRPGLTPADMYDLRIRLSQDPLGAQCLEKTPAKG